MGMPDTWANWVGTWDDIEEKYGITQADQDMSSAEEIAMFKQEGTDGTKDIGDVGQQWGPTAEAEGVTLKYKTSYWDEIPDWAKDDVGDWSWATTARCRSSPTTTRSPTRPRRSPSSPTATTRSPSATSRPPRPRSTRCSPSPAPWEAVSTTCSRLRLHHQDRRGRPLDVSDVSVARLESGEVAVGLNWGLQLP